MRLRLFAATPLWIGLSLASTAWAQHGAGDDRVSLPEGPGSLEGIGDNASISGNMGSMSYAVPIEVPAGFPAVTPNLALSYDSAGSAGVMGIGWDLSVPYVERMTNWRLPDYDLDDDFVAGGQLVHIGDGVYRNRFERGFARHTWHARGDGTQGYWTTELPDGTVQYFGATPAGELVDSARVAGRGGATFRYHLVAQVDKFGHRMEYSYRLYDGLPHLDRIEYIFTGSDGGPGASLTFEYADRPDAISDARSGANERRTQRLTHVNVFSKQVRIWRYTVHYEDEARSNGLSRVRRIDRVGLDDTPHPVAFDFEYSKTLANDNCDDDCDQPYLVDMGSIGVNLAAGDATLADMNGDGLPDIVDTSREGAHRIFVNRFAARDQHVFDAPYDSAVGDRAGHQLSSPYVQTLDANGDGRVDLVNVRTGEVLYNLGGGDWAEASALGNTAALPDFGDDFGGGADEPTHVRFFDYDNDRRIDVMRSSLDRTQIYANQGEAGFAVVDGINAIGAGFDGGLDLADMNGDGLLDPVILRPGSLSYRLNLGFGRWSAWVDIEDLPFNEAELDFVQLQDINGDSLDDLVIVIGDELRFALNRAGTRFDAAQTIEAVGGQRLPIRADGTTVLFADMNGSGSDDVVWISPQGDVTYLELFPIRPNLLTRLTNGLGLVTEVTYTTMVEERAASEEPWAYTLPFSMQMAKSIDTFDSYNDQHRRQTYDYADAFYDTQEKAYRGFARVQTTTVGDATQATSVVVSTYDLGVDDRYFNGLMTASQTYARDGDALAPVRSVIHTYDDCPVAEIPAAGLAWPVRSICRTATETLHQEQAPEDEWVRLRQTYEYDGYGNLTRAADLGVVDVGGAGCGACARDADAFGEPCGQTCSGDEMYTWSTFTRSQARWILGLPVRTASAAILDSPEASVIETRYDGDAFVGLPAGEATLGQVTRTRVQVDDATWIDATRARYDAHGNLIESLTPLGAVGSAAHRVTREYDDEHLLLSAVEVFLDGYSIRTENTYDPIWGVLDASDGGRVMVDGAPVTPANLTRLTYDALGQLSSRIKPGDPVDRPSVEYAREWGAPVTRLISRMRTTRGAAEADLTSYRCADGFGRQFTQIMALPDGRFEVGDYQVANPLGEVVASYRGHVTDESSCLLNAPDLMATRVRYDVLRRPVEMIREDAALYGVDSQTRVDFAPLVRTRYTPDDLDPANAAADTPMEQRFDGLGRQIAIVLDAGDGERLEYTYEYDVRGQLARVTDPAGDARAFVRDRMGRVVEATDADRGTTLMEYDAGGNVVRMEDANGGVRIAEFDALNRVTAEWDAADRAGTITEYAYDRPDQCPDDSCPNSPNQLVAVHFPGPSGRGSRWMTHDARGQLVAVRTALEGATLVERFEYDNLGRRVRTVQPDGTVTARTLDAMGRQIGIDGIAEFEWARSLLLGREILANGVIVDHAWDAAEMPASTRISGADGAIATWRYQYDRIGNLLAIDDVDAPADRTSRTARFEYDALNRMQTAHLDPGRPMFEELLGFEYDRSMNLVSKTSSRGEGSRSHVGALRYESDKPHAVTAAGARTYAYDAAGMMIDRDGQAIDWDVWQRPTRVTGDDAELARYWYADARIVSRSRDAYRWHVSPTFEVEDGIALTHHVLGNRRIATTETDALAPAMLGDLAPWADGAPQPDGVFDTGDAVVAALAQAGTYALPADARPAPLRSMLRGAVRSRLLGDAPRTVFAHHDATRQLVLETDAGGAVVHRQAVDPYGLDRQVDTDRGYEGRRTDASVGTLQMGDRTVDPWLGRWLSADPEFATGSPLDGAAPIQGANAYGFNLDNPIRYTDPSGRTAALAAALDRASVHPNFSLGSFARGQMAPQSVVDFVFDSRFLEMQQAVRDTLDQHGRFLNRELQRAKDTLAMALANQTLLADSPNIGAEGQRLVRQEVSEARTALKEVETELADFAEGSKMVRSNLYQTTRARQHRNHLNLSRAALVRTVLRTRRIESAQLGIKAQLGAGAARRIRTAARLRARLQRRGPNPNNRAAGGNGGGRVLRRFRSTQL